MEKELIFFNVKENRHGDLFLNIVESKKHDGSGFERHSVIVFSEDLEDFVSEFKKAVEFMQGHEGPAKPDSFRDNKDRDRRRDS